ncbi:cytochrome P450 [Streptomyces humi]|uniref:cytochrome P450 n=1 Tax=Streptomyces humi TaxID=1428620 RepID=UPI000628830D|nr:cytochrome P450 [Streptomyces humi]
MTPESPRPAGPSTEPAPPPGCPAHDRGSAHGGAPAADRGPGGLHRLFGADADHLGELYEQLREEHGAVAPVLLHDDVPVWVVLGLTENLQMVRTPAVFTRDSRIWTPLREGMVKPDHPLMPHIAWQPICSHAEGDEHLRLRAAVQGAMTTIDHRSIRRLIGRYTQLLVNEFCEKGHAELVSQYSEHLPMAVMCELLGMPEEYNDRIVEATRDALKGTATAIASNEYVMSCLTRLTARRRARAEDDFTSHLVNHPARLNDDEVAQHLRVVLYAAYETTANLLANALRMVLTEPGFRAQLNGGQMTVPEAIEQSLWDEPPFSTVFAYFAKQDTELGGQRIRKGDGLLYAPAPGNVDPRVRPDLNANMQGNRSHLAFGGGPHECPGQDIGRAIADVGVDQLLTRLSDIQLDCEEEELRWRASIASRHLVELPVRFDPKPKQDVTLMPSPALVPPQRTDWQAAPTRPAPVPPVPPAPEPSAHPAPVAPPVPEPGTAPRGIWPRLRRWWLGR